MTADIKPGDRVRTTVRSKLNLAGKCGTVIEPPSQEDIKSFPFWVRLDGFEHDLGFNAQELEPAPAAPAAKTADLKPGDLVRDTRVWTVEAVNGDSAHLSLDGHNRLAGTHYLERVSAAPASEPEMQDSVDDAAREIAQTLSGLPDPGGFDGRDAAKAIIARHLTERDARIAELERERDDAHAQSEAHEQKFRCLSAHETCGCSYDRPGDVCMHHSPALVAAEDRARAAEAALAEEREACCHLAATAGHSDDGDPWVKGYNEACEDIALRIRSRTITAEGADTGSAEHG